MKKIIIIFVGLFLTNLAISQTASPELVSSAGESFYNSTYQLDWSVGECITATHTKDEIVITQGFHQDRYIITTAIENLQNIEINISIYPNPTTEFINIRIESSKTESLQYILTDISGKILQCKKAENNIEQIDFSTFTSGIYFLTVKQENQIINSFKIMKN